MQGNRIAQILQGKPCSLNNNQIMELGAKCSSESYSLEKLIQVSKTLFKNDSQSCFRFLQYVEKHQITRNIYKDFTHQPYKIQIYYSLAALALAKAIRQCDKQNIQKWQKQFNKYMNEGSKVKTSAQKLNQLLRGFNSYYSGDFNQSITNFNWLEQFDKKDGTISTVALIGLAQSNFMLKKYDKALQYYKRALISNKNLPSKARIGMAYCFYQLEKYQLAEKCFQRILVLDPNCFEAYMGLAVINYRNNHIQKYFQFLKKAHQLRPNDPLTILHLSEHFLFQGQYQKCQKMSVKGLQAIQLMPKFLKKQNQQLNYRDDYELYKARFNNLIGQVHHAKNEYEQARKYYELAKQKGLKYNEICLAQIYIHSNLVKQALTIFQNTFGKAKITQLKIIAQYNKTYAYLQVKANVKSASEQLGPNHYFKQALKYNKNDYQALIDYSTFLFDTNQKKQTLKILQMALKALQVTGKQVKTELLNNIAVCLIEQKNIVEAYKTMVQAQKLLGLQSKTNMQQQLKYHALYLTLFFNKSIILELEHKYSQAIKIHEQLIKYNKFYIDSYVRLADILYQLGKKSSAFQLLQTAINECTKIKFQQMRFDKLISMKSYLQLIDGSIAQARQTFRKYIKPKFPYDQLYQICLGYELVIKKQLEKAICKEYLHSNRQIIIQICNGDPYNIFAFMILTILFLTDNKITREQGIQYFNQLKIAQFDFPEIQFNFGVFSITIEDYQNALLCLNRFKDRTKSNKADEYIALTYFLKGDYTQCINTIKKNILNEPNNLKYRFQYAYANEKRIQKLYEQQKNFKDLKISTKFLGMCQKIYKILSKTISADYLKSVQNSQLKEKVRNQIAKIRNSCQDRQRFVQAQISHYKTRQKQIIEKERKLAEQQNNRLQQLRKAKQKQKLFENINQDDNDSDSQKQRQQRRRRLILKSIQQSQKANQLWRINRQKQKQQQQQKQQNKRQRRNNEGKKPKKQRKAQKQQKDRSQQDYQSQKEFSERSVPSQEYQSNSEQHEKKKKKKKKNKNRDRSGSDQNEGRKKKKKKKKLRKERSGSQDSKKSQSEKQISRKDQEDEQEDPFKGIESNKSGDKQQEQIRQRQQPQKKNKKKGKDDDDNINIDDFIIH